MEEINVYQIVHYMEEYIILLKVIYVLINVKMEQYYKMINV